MGHILLTHARIVLRVMEDGGVMENANGAMVNAKNPKNMDLVIVMNLMKIVGADICIIMTMNLTMPIPIVIIVVKMMMIVGNHVRQITNFTEYCSVEPL